MGLAPTRVDGHGGPPPTPLGEGLAASLPRRYPRRIERQHRRSATKSRSVIIAWRAVPHCDHVWLHDCSIRQTLDTSVGRCLTQQPKHSSSQHLPSKGPFSPARFVEVVGSCRSTVLPSTTSTGLPRQPTLTSVSRRRVSCLLLVLSNIENDLSKRQLRLECELLLELANIWHSTFHIFESWFIGLVVRNIDDG